jgi:ActR/RegA family two-component response regulator
VKNVKICTAERPTHQQVLVDDGELFAQVLAVSTDNRQHNEAIVVC